MSAALVSPFGSLLTAQQAATRAGLRITLLRRLVASGEITALRHRNGRLIGVFEKDIDEFLRVNRTADTPHAAAQRDVDSAMDALISKIHVAY